MAVDAGPRAGVVAVEDGVPVGVEGAAVVRDVGVAHALGARAGVVDIESPGGCLSPVNAPFAYDQLDLLRVDGDELVGLEHLGKIPALREGPAA